MIRVDEVPCRIQCMFPSVAELELATLEALGNQNAVVGDSSQGKHHSYRLENRKLGLQVGIAAADFIRERLVFGGYTFDRIDDASVP